MSLHESDRVDQGPRRRRARIDHDERRALILQAGATVFREQGLRGATMDDVAAQAGISKVLVYRVFPSKDALVAEIFGEVLQLLESVRGKPWGGYAAGTVDTIAAARERPDAFLLLYRDCRGDPLYRHHFERLQSFYVDWLMGYFEPLRDSTTLEAERARMAVRTLTGFLFEALANWLQTGTAEEDVDFARWIGEMIRDWRWNTEQTWRIPRHRATR